MSEQFQGETLLIANKNANPAFDEMDSRPENSEIPEISGFRYAGTHSDLRDARSGRVPAYFLIERISDGVVFGADFSEPADDNFWAESPFYPKDGTTTFREIERKERVVVEVYYEYK